MCGLAGILTGAAVAAPDLDRQARSMIAPLVHRGPDAEGVWVHAAAGVALGFRRLAIIDLSPNGDQPMRSASGRFVMVFNGEVYNFAELRRTLEQCGHAFRGHSDSEVVLASFEQWGIPAAIQRFVGMFAIAVWDGERRELSLVRDRLGKKPLYVYAEPGLITFGSELKALAAGPSFDRTIDRAALAAYFRFLCVPAPRTIYARAMKLLPGHVLTVSNPRAPLPPSEPYWSLGEVARRGAEDPFDGTEADAIDELDARLREAVGSRMHSDVPLGALLSGGIDSSTVVAFMQEASSRPVRTYTIGFADEAFDEGPYAADVARHLGTDHTAIVLTGEDAHALIPGLPDVFDEPFADPSQLPTLLVSRLARQHVTVALCGDGGDELFGGYNRYVYGASVLPRINRLPRLVRQPVAAGMRSVPVAAWDRLCRMGGSLAPAVAGGRVGERIHKLSAVMSADSVGDMYQSLLSAWQHPEHLVGPSRGTADPDGRAVDEASPAHLLDRMMLADQTAYLPDDLLAKVDRASMAVSLEVRAPLLDHRIVEFSWRLPRTLKLRGTVGKWILRQVLYRRVPKDLVDRPKMGFSVPIDRWLRGPLRAWGEGLLAEDELRRNGLLDPGPVRRAWRDLQEGRRTVGAALWAVIMFQSWRARWDV